jgi:hypothetical protein
MPNQNLKTCVECSTLFKPEHNNEKTCSDSCKKKRNTRVWKEYKIKKKSEHPEKHREKIRQYNRKHQKNWRTVSAIVKRQEYEKFSAITKAQNKSNTEVLRELMIDYINKIENL